jgi:hypothetical protein
MLGSIFPKVVHALITVFCSDYFLFFTFHSQMKQVISVLSLLSCEFLKNKVKKKNEKNAIISNFFSHFMFFFDKNSGNAPHLAHPRLPY